jgi:exodeoxyribonuclease X
MNALILDTETHDLNGYPIEIAYAPCSFEQGVLVINQGKFLMSTSHALSLSLWVL